MDTPLRLLQRAFQGAMILLMLVVLGMIAWAMVAEISHEVLTQLSPLRLGRLICQINGVSP